MSAPQVAIDAVTHYLQKGIARGPAIGIVSVLYAGESQLNPGPQPSTVTTDHGGVLYANGAYGIASWNGPRQQALANFAAAKGLPVGAVNTQLDFVLTECANSYSGVWAAIQQGMAYTPFINLFVTQYEGPANPSSEISRSVAFAQQLDMSVPQAVPTPAPAPTVPVVTPTPTPSPIGAFTMDPATIALLGQMLQVLAPILEAQAVALIKALAPAAAGTATASTAAPAVDVASLGTAVVSQIGPVIQQIVASELQKVIGTITTPTTGVKS